jgi:hypothetical protein
MKLNRKIRLLAGFVLTQCLWGVHFAAADTVYTYTGDNYTFVTPLHAHR